MLETVKNWYEEIKEVSTEESNWGVETIELEKVELDINLLPEGIQDGLPSNEAFTILYRYTIDMSYRYWNLGYVKINKDQLIFGIVYFL